MIEIPSQIASLMSVGLGLVFYVTLLVFTFYTVFLAYHWFSYGTSRVTSMLSLAIFLLGSVPLFLVMSITF